MIKDLLDHIKPISSGIRVGRIYKMNVRSASYQALTSLVMNAKDLCHQIFGHFNFNYLLLLHKQGMVDCLPALKNVHVDCGACALGKVHRDEFPVNVDRNKRYILELVHTDLCGPMQTRSLEGAYYFLLFIDDCTRFTWVHFLRKIFILFNTVKSSEA